MKLFRNQRRGWLVILKCVSVLELILAYQLMLGPAWGYMLPSAIVGVLGLALGVYFAQGGVALYVTKVAAGIGVVISLMALFMSVVVNIIAANYLVLLLCIALHSLMAIAFYRWMAPEKMK